MALRIRFKLVEPTVTSLFDELIDAAKVVERLRADAALTAMERKSALQLVLQRGLVQPSARPANAAMSPE